MDEQRHKIIRFSITGIGIIFIFLFLINSYNIFNQLNTASEVNAINLDYENLNLISTIIYLLIGYFLIKISISWSNIFKSLTKTFVSFAIICLTFYFLLLPVGNNATEITNNIQPSIDYILMGSIDDMINQQFNTIDEDISVVISQDDNIVVISNSNLKQSDINLIISTFKLNDYNDEQKKDFTEFLVSIIGDELSKNETTKDIPIPLDQLEKTISSQIDLNSLKEMDTSLLDVVYPTNPNAQINILISSDNEEIIVNPNKLTNEQIDLIWSTLDFNNTLSYETKNKLISLILSQSYLGMQTELNNIDMDTDISIPISTLKYSIPESLKNMFEYDIFNNNISVRVDALNKIKYECKTNQEQDEITKEFCAGIMMTEYDTLMKNFNNITESSNQQELPENIDKFIEPISSLQKIENKLMNMKSLANQFLLYTIILFVMAILSYYAHFKLFNRELIKTHIPYYISKLNLLSFIFNFILLGIIYILINNDILLNSLPNFMNNMGLDINLNLIKNIPLFDNLKNINSEMFIIASIYMIFSILLFVLFYFLQKQELKQIDY